MTGCAGGGPPSLLLSACTHLDGWIGVVLKAFGPGGEFWPRISCVFATPLPRTSVPLPGVEGDCWFLSGRC